MTQRKTAAAPKPRARPKPKPRAKPAAKTTAKKPPARSRAKKDAEAALEAVEAKEARKGKKDSIAASLAAPDALSGPGNAAKRMLRDTRIVQRYIQGWPWPAIAEEAGLSERAAQKAFAARKATMPLALQQDPVEVIEQIMEGYQLTVGDAEAIAVQAVNEGKLSVAVAAKKLGTETREKQVRLLQATGRLPQDLQSLRHLLDMRGLAVQMVDAVEGLSREVEVAGQIEDPGKRAKALASAAERVHDLFMGLTGVEQAGLTAPDVIDVESV